MITMCIMERNDPKLITLNDHFSKLTYIHTHYIPRYKTKTPRTKFSQYFPRKKTKAHAVEYLEALNKLNQHEALWGAVALNALQATTLYMASATEFSRAD